MPLPSGLADCGSAALLQLFAVVCLALFLERPRSLDPSPHSLAKVSRQFRGEFQFDLSLLLCLAPCRCACSLCPTIFAKFVNVLLMEFEHLLGVFWFGKGLLYVGLPARWN